MTEASSSADLLNNLAHEFAERYRLGERPVLTEYTDKYPELAADIRELFPAMVVMEQFGQPTGAEGKGVAADGPMPLQLGEYRILREVARGGMGTWLVATLVQAVQKVCFGFGGWGTRS